MTTPADPIRDALTGTNPDPATVALTDALGKAGLTLSDTDQATVNWLDGADAAVSTCIADWVTRAASGKA